MDVVRVALSGPTTPNRVLELFLVVVVVPFETVNGPLVPDVPVESIAEAVAAPNTVREMAISDDFKMRWELKRDDLSFTIAPLALGPSGGPFRWIQGPLRRQKRQTSSWENQPFESFSSGIEHFRGPLDESLAP